jgi:RNA polymerase sigma-70 factor (ECF subfamily)
MRLLLANEREITRYVCALVPSTNDAEEIVQQTAILLWQKFDQYDQSRPFAPWACRFALNVSKQWMARRKRWSKLLEAGLAEELAMRREELKPQFDARRSQLKQCMHELPEQQRVIVEAYYFEKLDIEAVAEQAGRSVEAVYKALQRIRRQLRHCITLSLSEIDDESLAELHGLLSGNQEAQDEYLWRVELHSELATSDLGFEPLRVEPAPSGGVMPMWPALLAVAAGIALVSGLWFKSGQGPTAATTVAAVTQLHDATWMTSDAALVVNEEIDAGQRVELRSGKADVLFHSGARMQLIAPAIVVPLTDSSAQLVLGQVHLVAETPSSKGFTVKTPTSDFIDISTAFTASVAPDGLSRLEVVDGEVDVVLDEAETTQRLTTGGTLFVEPGERKVITRIESGDGTPDFRFSTIAPPSADDYADLRFGRARIQVAKGQLRVRQGGAASGAPSVLLDGVGQSKQDSPLESVFFENGVIGQFLLDLGERVTIHKVNCYSWHQHRVNLEHRHRARQHFTLYGFAGDEPPDASALAPEDTDWVRIARVNSDRSFKVTDALKRPSQQASSISAASGDLGRYRYLLWVVERPTFFGEFDVYTVPDKQGVH